MTCDTGRPGPETCGCCEPAAEPTGHANPPGRDALEYRVGTHAGFLARMRGRIHAWPDDGERPLAALSGRGSDEPAVALMDAAAVMADVLTFYQEHIANEGFLRTAVERRSVLELARAIGYELAPGVAAETWLAFSVDDSAGAPAEADVPAATQVHSLPASQGELPQTFETAEAFTAHVTWNALRPRLRRAQAVSASVTRIYLEGTGLNLAPGDLLLLRIPGAAMAKETAKDARKEARRKAREADDVFGRDSGRKAAPSGPEEELVPLRVLAVAEDAEAGFTRVDLSSSAAVAAGALWPGYADAVLTPASTLLKLTRSAVAAQVFRKTWSEADLQAFLAMHQWDAEELLDYVADLRSTALAGSGELYALRERLGFFGHNAPRWESLPDPSNTRAGACASTSDPYATNWDANPPSVWKNSQGTIHTDADVYLERTVKNLAEEGWVVFEAPSGATLVQQAYQVTRVFDTSRADFGMSAKVSALELRVPTGGSKHSRLLTRTSTAHVSSERLALAALPVDDDLPAGLTELVLDTMVLGLEVGRTVALSGEEPDADGRERRELLELEAVSHSGGYTKLTFVDPTAYAYGRESVRINANLVRANHGETVAAEVLGSGDGAAARQRFALRQSPLTHVGSTDASGAASTLELRVDGIAWRQSESLYELGPDDRGYIVRIDDDARARVRFGDGKHGARLPSGSENVVARYRHGIGLDGEVGEGSLTLLKTRPFGIRKVTNPLAASGAADPEKLADARDNAPLQVLTLQRIVSLRDYQDFARAYAGIGKARADAVWDGRAERLHVTVADANGDPVVDPLYGRLFDAMEAARDPLRELLLASFQPRLFFVEAKVLIDEDRLWSDVKPALEAALREHFGFARRAFAQPVTAAEVVAVMHAVAGVRAVDLDALYQTAPDESPPAGGLFSQVLPSLRARWDEASGGVLPAQLLLIHEYGIKLQEMLP